MNIFIKASLISVVGLLGACAQTEVDQSVITLDKPTTKFAKYSPSNLEVPSITRFSHPQGETATWKTAYADCARNAGVEGDIELIMREYGTYNTVDLSNNDDITDAEFTAAFWCMSEFASKG